MKNMKKLIFLAIFVLFLIPLGTKAQNEFNPSMLISDYDLLNFKSMSLDQIQRFLESKNSYLATYKTLNAYGQERSAAQIIYDAAVNNYDCSDANLSDKPTEEERKLKCKTIGTVNPQFLIVLLQKEQSLIESHSPRESQLDWATGYGCPDASACNPYFKGFGKQINSAALQFRWYMLSPQSYSFKAGQTYTFRNQYGTINNATMNVTIENQATAALYNYTPHVYNGNYNFWAIWNRYFPAQGYPNGTILKAGDDYWLIQSGEKRKFSSISVLSSRFDPAKAIPVQESDLYAYSEGAPIKFHNYAIIMSPEGKLYLLVDDKKRLFSSTATFKQLGFNIEEIQNAAWQDINSYQDAKEITVASAYPTGALLQNKKTGGVYFVIEETKAPVIDKIFLNTKYKGKTIIPVEESELATYQTVSPIRFDNGELIKSQGSPAVYLIQDNQKRAFATGEIFEELGYKWSNIITVSDKVLNLYQSGELIQ